MQLFNSYREWKKIRQTQSELLALSSRELNDLGINRGDIPFIARTAVRGK